MPLRNYTTNGPEATDFYPAGESPRVADLNLLEVPMFAEINNFKMAYDDRGEGPPVILIHGFPLCRAMWRAQVEALVRAGYRVITPDLRGFGESEATPAGYDMQQLADDTAALMDHLGIKSAVVGGMSMGGYVLHALLDRRLEKVSAAIFIVTRSVDDTPEGKDVRTELARAAEEGHPEAPAEAFGPILFAGPTYEKDPGLVQTVRSWMLNTAPEALAGALIGMRDRKNYLPELSRFDRPALVIGAEFDSCIPPSHAEATARGLPNARLVIIPEAGHMVNMEKPATFNDALLGFLALLSPDSPKTGGRKSE